MHWLYLILAIAFEVTATSCMKASAGLTRLAPTLAMVAFYIVSFTLLTLATKVFDVSIVYAIWSGLGTALITLVGVTVFREPATLVKFFWIAVIVVGVVGLNLSGDIHGSHVAADEASPDPPSGGSPVP